MKTKIKQGYLMYKRRLADMLQRKTDCMPVRRKKLLLVLFCVVFTGFSLQAIIHAFTEKAKPVVARASMPRVQHEKETPVLPFISKQEFERIEKFKQQIYALPKPVYDSFMQARPKLVDSIVEIEHYYQSQK